MFSIKDDILILISLLSIAAGNSGFVWPLQRHV